MSVRDIPCDRAICTTLQYAGTFDSEAVRTAPFWSLAAKALPRAYATAKGSLVVCYSRIGAFIY
jgi:hypothetical protein